MVSAASPHCTSCGALAEEGEAGVAVAEGDRRGLIFLSCAACSPGRDIPRRHCLVCGDETGGLGPLEGVLFAGQPVEVAACLTCYDRILREDPALAWVDGLALTAVSAPILS